jgi:hypothetical protein
MSTAEISYENDLTTLEKKSPQQKAKEIPHSKGQ